MRLICPNCGAQYEVEDAVIPEQGRDVQCSNCGHTWFQQPAHLDVETADELGQELPPPPETKAPESEQPAPERQELDPEIANVLREEAARETAARESGSEGLETQPDLGLDESAQAAADRSAAARARMARLRGADDAEAEAAIAEVVATGSRKELLPDVEEINSSLRATEDRAPAVDDGLEAEPENIAPKSKGGRRFAFRLIVILALLALALYIFAPQIAQSVPQTQPYLAKYLEFVNGLRDQVDPLIASGVDWVKGMIGSE